MRFLWLMPAWLLMNLALVGPQAALACDSLVLAVVVGLAAMGLLLWMFVRIAPTRNSAFVGVGIPLFGLGVLAFAKMKSEPES